MIKNDPVPSCRFKYMVVLFHTPILLFLYSALHPNPLRISVLIHRQLLHNKINLFVIGADISFFCIYRYICARFQNTQSIFSSDDNRDVKA